MSSFRESIQKGLTAHEKAQRESKEIEEVLEELRNELLELTEGAVSIRIKIFTEQNTRNRTAIDAAIAALAIAPEGKKYEALSIQAEGTSGTGTKVANWEKSASGYPVTIRANGQKWDCYDRKSLVATLQSLMATPQVGKAISNALKQTKRPQ